MGRLIYSLNVSLDGFVETTGPLARMGGRRRRGPHVVQRAGARSRRVAVRPADVRADERLLAARRDRPGRDRDDARVLPDLEGDAEDRVLVVAGLGRWQRAARPRRRRGGGAGPRRARSSRATSTSAARRSAASFIRRGLVDEFRLVVHPVVLGSGTPFFPALDEPLRLKLIETKRFASGVTYLGYEAVRS